MDTLVRPPVDEPTGTAEPRRRHRWPWVVGAATIVTLLALAITATVWLDRYQPLTLRGLGTFVDPAHSQRVGDFSPPVGESFDQYDVTYADGQPFRFGFTITNHGRLPVTIEEVRLPPCGGCVHPLEYVGTQVGPAAGPRMFLANAATPFVPFRLGPDEYRFVVITSRFDHCAANPRSTYATFTNVQVRYGSGWIDHTATMPLPYALTVARDSACPA